MKTLILRAGGFLRRNKNNLYYFWKYAIRAKLHFRKYQSTKVIMLRLDLIGDCTMFSNAAKVIRESYGDREMTMVCLSSTKPIFERLGIFDKIVSVDFKPYDIDYAKLPGLISELRTEEYDLLLQPQASKYPIADILGAAIKCNKRIAIETKIGNSSKYWVRIANLLYDRFIPYPRDSVSEFDYYGAFVRGLCDPDYKTRRPALPYGKQRFIEGDYYVLYPGASATQRMWPAERFAKLANHIHERTGLTGVILGAASEQWVSDRLKKELDQQTSMVDLTGKTSIPDVIDVIGNAKFVVSNDTSGVHIACATNTPSVANVGGGHLGRFLPYHIEKTDAADQLPLVAYTQMPCYDCDWNCSTIGERNPDCLCRWQRGEPFECISKITYEQMCELVDQVIHAEGLQKD